MTRETKAQLLARIELLQANLDRLEAQLAVSQRQLQLAEAKVASAQHQRQEQAQRPVSTLSPRRLAMQAAKIQAMNTGKIVLA